MRVSGGRAYYANGFFWRGNKFGQYPSCSNVLFIEKTILPFLAKLNMRKLCLRKFPKPQRSMCALFPWAEPSLICLYLSPSSLVLYLSPISVSLHPYLSPSLFLLSPSQSLSIFISLTLTHTHTHLALTHTPPIPTEHSIGNTCSPSSSRPYTTHLLTAC